MNFIPSTIDEAEQLYFGVPPREQLLPPMYRRRRVGASPASATTSAVETGAEETATAIPADVVLATGVQPDVPSSQKQQGSEALPANPGKSITHSGLKALVRNAPGDIVAGMIPKGSVNIAVGDSGLGKTPLLVQLGICVAAGKPFLNQAVRQGRVLWVDFENGLSGLDSLLDTLAGHLSLEAIPEDFRILSQPISIRHVLDEIRAWRPSLVIIDSLRGYDPLAEQKNSSAGEMLANCQKICSETGAAILFIHHIRKQDAEYPRSLISSDSALTWLSEASGARALVNQTAVRIGIDKALTAPAELILRGHYKLCGEIGPWQIARKYDETGEPTGYYRLSGVLLLQPDQRETFRLLPPEFTFGEAERRYGRKGGKPTAQFLKRCQAAGLLVKSGSRKQTRYRKMEPSIPGSEGSNAEGAG
jgi:hypothetical protein